MGVFSLELSDGLYNLRSHLIDLSLLSKPARPEDLAVLAECCGLLERRARELECEVSKSRWNEQARRENDRLRMHDLLDAATRPGSNVTLFPVIHRPVPPSAPIGAA